MSHQTIIKNKLTFKDMFSMEGLGLCINSEILKNDLMAVFTRNNGNEIGSELSLLIVKGEVKRCFVRLDFILYGIELNLAEPIFYKLTGDDEVGTACDVLEKSDFFLEAHWLKNKFKICPLNMNSEYPDLSSLLNLDVGTVFGNNDKKIK